jgi:hypothetical protein
VTTVLFIYSAVISTGASGTSSHGEIEVARKYLKLANLFGTIGLFVMLFEIACIAFYAGLPHGILVVAVSLIGLIVVYRSGFLHFSHLKR